MRYPRILDSIRSARWAVRPATLQAIVDTLGAHMRGAEIARDPLSPAVPPFLNTPKGVAIVPVHGIIGKRLSSLETECGGCDIDAVSNAFDAAVSNPAVQLVVLDFASPGGTITGVTEFAARIRNAAMTKPVFAFTAEQCCSAAYWLASACNAVFCTPSSEVGSVGVYVAMVDDSEWFKKEGYKLELIKAGQFKAMGISGRPLTDDERSLVQTDVDTIYAMFVDDIRKNRGAVADATLQGQTFLGANAVTALLADEVVPSIDALIEDWQSHLSTLPAGARARVVAPVRGAVSSAHLPALLPAAARPALTPSASTALSVLVDDALMVYDVMHSKWGAGVAFLNGRSVSNLDPVGHLIERRKEAEKSATLATYFRIVEAMPETVTAARAAAALDAAFGTGSWRCVLSVPLADHPIRTQGRLASALLTSPPVVKNIISRVTSAALGAPKIVASSGSQKEVPDATEVPFTSQEQDREIIRRSIRQGYVPNAPSAEAARRREKEEATALLDKYDSLYGQEKIQFYNTNGAAIYRAREVAKGKTFMGGSLPHLTGLGRVTAAFEAQSVAKAAAREKQHPKPAQSR